jgi:uncharacterized protein (TIGR02271 family)
MNEQTLVAVYTVGNADAALRDLSAANVPADAITQHTRSGSFTGTTTTAMAAPIRGQGFWSNLFGGEPDHDTAMYDRSIDRGSTVLTVKVPAEDFDRVSTILERHDPVELDTPANQHGSAEMSTTRPTPAPTFGVQEPVTSAARSGILELAEETLSVGKRAVSGGTTRIRRYVVETPAEEQVTLRTERVTMDRHPVADGRPLGAADFTDKTIEMTETSEEAVVSKTARITEEVSLRKEASDRVETVRDTVRRDEVEIEQVPGGSSTGASRTAGIGPVMPTSARRDSKI